jgi:hypothetical protein
MWQGTNISENLAAFISREAAKFSKTPVSYITTQKIST